MNKNQSSRLVVVGSLIKKESARSIAIATPYMEGFSLVQFIETRVTSASEVKPKRRVKKQERNPLMAVQEAARAGNAQFQYYVETGKLPVSK